MGEKIKNPIIGRVYRHIKGDFYTILGFAEMEQTPAERQIGAVPVMVVIYCNTMTSKNYIRPLSTFFDLHPTTKQPRFELVTLKDEN